MLYQVTYQSVDGAGSYPHQYATKAAAVAVAHHKQTLSDLYAYADEVNGTIHNPWRYSYAVRDESGRVVHRTQEGMTLR